VSEELCTNKTKRSHIGVRTHGKAKFNQQERKLLTSNKKKAICCCFVKTNDFMTSGDGGQCRITSTPM